MFKSIIDRTAEHPMVVIGLSRGNIERMRQDDPVLFNLIELGLDDRWVSISWKHADNTAAFPQGFQGVGLAFTDKVLDAFLNGQRQTMEADDITFIVFGGETEQAMEQMIREAGLIGPDT